MMNVVIYKPFVEVGTFDEFKTLKLSVDNTDSIYITYENNTQTYGTPDIKWGQFVFIVDRGIIYLKGRFFEEKDEFILSSDYAISSLERENLLLQPGDTFEEAFGKIEKNIIDNETTVSNINDRIDTVSYVSYNVIPSYNRPVSSGAVYTAIDTAIGNLIGSAPAALDTLEEIATSLNNNNDLAGTLTTQISSKIPKVSNPTVGNYVTLASDGTLVDSGHSHSDYITEETRSDWNENDTSSYAYVLNKPDLSIYLTQHQSIKTINNQTITGTGNLNIAELPTVTSADNGKILMVVNGEWAVVSPWDTDNS